MSNKIKELQRPKSQNRPFYESIKLVIPDAFYVLALVDRAIVYADASFLSTLFTRS